MVNDEATADRFEEAIIVDGDNENENEITFTDDIHDEQAENWFHCETEEPREEPLSVWYDCESEVTNEDIPGSTEDDQPTSEEGNIPIYQGASLTVAHSALLILTFAMRHNLTGECLSDLLTLISLHCLSTSFIHTSLYKFRTYFSKLKAPLIFQKYCSNCEGLLQKNTDNCHICNINLSEKKVSYFVEIPVAYQLQQLFSRTTFHQELLHRFKRKMHNKGNIEDVYDGKLYSSLSHNSGFLDDANIISFMWYTDGVPLFKSSKISLWPLFLTINELPYLERIKQDNMLFAGLWFGKSKPSMASFLRPFHDSFNNLQKNGINVECAHCSHITVRGLVLCGTCDLPAKCTMMNMHQFNGQYGCPKCKQEGTVVKTWKGHTRIYPFCEDLIHGPKRTHKEFIIDGEKEFATSKHVYGVKGPSWWVDISADVINGIGIDYMHTVLLGLVRRLLVLWFDPKFSSETFSISSLVDVADKRLGLIKPPYFINRKPRSIKEHAHYWKASECRAWLFFYSIPVLYGLLKKSNF